MQLESSWYVIQHLLIFRVRNMLVLKLVDISPEELPEFIMFKLLSKCEIVVTIWLEVFPNLRFLTYQSLHLIMAFLYKGRQFSCHID